MNVFNVASYFLSKEAMSILKLQLILYYSQGIYMSVKKEKIFKESFLAGKNGASLPKLWQRYYMFLGAKIPSCSKEKNIEDELSNFLDDVWNTYGCLTEKELIEKNTSEAPWLNARGNLKAWEICARNINNEDMVEYFNKLI